MMIKLQTLDYGDASVKLPSGEIHQRDCEYFERNDISVTMQQISAGDFAVSVSATIKNSEDEKMVLIEVADGRTCAEVMKVLRKRSEKYLALRGVGHE